MARSRMIRPEFWEDSKMSKLSAYARLLFIAMWNFADDEGYLQHDLEWIKAKCFPYDKVDVDKLLKELFDMERIGLNNDVILIKNFLKYQKIQHPTESELKITFMSPHEEYSNTHEDSRALQKTILQDKISKDKIREDKISVHEEIFLKWNDFAKENPPLSTLRELSEDRKVKLKKRLEKKSFNFDEILTAIKEQDFLIKGTSDRNWRVNFDWLIENDTNYLKVIERKYKKQNEPVPVSNSKYEFR